MMRTIFGLAHQSLRSDRCSFVGGPDNWGKPAWKTVIVPPKLMRSPSRSNCALPPVIGLVVDRRAINAAQVEEFPAAAFPAPKKRAGATQSGLARRSPSWRWASTAQCTSLLSATRRYLARAAVPLVMRRLARSRRLRRRLGHIFLRLARREAQLQHRDEEMQLIPDCERYAVDLHAVDKVPLALPTSSTVKAPSLQLTTACSRDTCPSAI